MNDLPNPLTPADCDLRDFSYMPLDVLRLRDSDLAARLSGEEFRCAVLLWCASWHQVPAASLPDDDVNLAQYAGFGRMVEHWLKVRERALRGWIKATDGRLYHAVVAEKANEAWNAKHKLAYDKLSERVRKRNKARADNLPPLEIPEFEAWLDAGRPLERALFPAEFGAPSGGNPKPSGGSNGNSGGSSDSSGGKKQASGGKKEPFQRNAPDLPPENALKGEERKGEESKPIGSVIVTGTSEGIARDDDDLVPGDPAAWCRYWRERHGVEINASSVHHRNKTWPLFAAWTNAGITRRLMDTAVAKAQAEAKQTIAFLPSYVDRVLATMQSAQQPAAPRQSPDELRRAVSDANAAAWLAGTPAADPNVIDMEH
ncbi:YdaU family protein [Ralstonia pickettii]|uniref:DUF1376 domain-containing protein n=1 Tax=Ralstonia pickettii TaxID=329 RepID=UPI0027151010|nr:DUF1376 domain-containing protein [Ralstonia pickettii]WKZ84189.1 YdaU family protein [Ralstonia pickettii]